MTAPNSDSPVARHEPKQSASAAPRIYGACLAAYNNGAHHGRWIDVIKGPDVMPNTPSFRQLGMFIKRILHYTWGK